MDEDWSYMTESILTLTLEIIYLLTGEDYEVMKKTPKKDKSKRRLRSFPRKIRTNHTSIMGPLTSRIPVRSNRSNKQKILEVTKKIVELLTGEVPIRCQDVAVYLSMEEWEYLEGHRQLYKAAMMEEEPPLTSPDGSSEGTSPARSPLHLYSRDPTQEDQESHCHDQLENVPIVKAEAAEDEEGEEDDKPVMLQYHQSEKEDIPTQTGSGVAIGGGRSRNISEEDLLSTQDCQVKYEKVSQDSPEENPITPTSNPALHSVDRSPDPSDQEEPPPNNFNDVIQRMGQRGNKLFPCSACGKRFTSCGGLLMHQRLHTGEKPFSCSVCGKSFTQKRILVNHEKIHQGIRPFPCSLCGKCFAKKSDVVRHMTVHTGEKPYPCERCGKRFSQRSSLLNHLRLSVCEKPFPCLLCGKRFLQRSDLARHQEFHRKKSTSGEERAGSA